jgi:hypothetical protein
MRTADEPRLLPAEELAQALSSSNAPRVTVDQIKSRIANVAFLRLVDTTVTICSITLDNGYSVRGESACVDPANFNQEIGERIAYDNAFRNLWPLFGFLLAELRHLAPKTEPLPTLPAGWKRYRSHKVVEAVEIAGVSQEVGLVAPVEGEHVDVPDNFFGRGTPETGDFLVRYAPDAKHPNGYLSWSPRRAFLDGYTPA